MTVTRLAHEQFDWSTGAGGASDVRRICDAATEADGRSPLNEAVQLTLRNHGLSTGILLAGRLDPPSGADQRDSKGGSARIEGRVGGFGFVHGLYGVGRPELELVVEPSARGAGLGTEIARAVLDAVDGIPLTAWSHGNHPGAAALARRVGFEAVRELWVMRRSSETPVPEAAVPAGCTIRSFRPGDGDGFLAVNAAAFAHHPEQGGLDRKGLAQRAAEPWFDPAGFLVAEREGRIVGFHWTKVHPTAGGSPPHGEVYVIGVDPSMQGSGLGRALLAAGLDHLHAQGLDEVVLYVEGDNHGAVALYSSYGFTHAPADTDVMYAGPR